MQRKIAERSQADNTFIACLERRGFNSIILRKSMRKIIYSGCLLILLLFLSSKVCYGASGINSNEQEIINRVRAGFMVDGKYYTVDSKYINQGINYLNKDGVDITAEQKSMIFAKMAELAPQGVSRGYLKPGNKEQGKIEKGNEAAGGKESGNTKGKDADSNSESNNNSETDLNALVIQSTSKYLNSMGNSKSEIAQKTLSYTRMSLEELINSAKEISSRMGVSVSYDFSHNEVKVIDQKGKAVMSAESVIKNTGFRFNVTLLVCGVLTSLIIICIFLAKYNGLFNSLEEDI
ncbi:hypothetical protein [Anaerocolumna sp. MB42-C2]|uniref:hypothetical protein n=1 Tax=Anaerocolumna sp. MB42-C2 TaxID=3070997 RepID=UPI0027E14A05|nr:hypothetical protein [Anaerocolumna sp. MB42-C2]WMJ85799.1 hypothetical protein RBU59_17225 [Anaerocolumna sp. MB42-C2]